MNELRRYLSTYSTCVSAILIASVAHADGTCSDAFEHGQELRRAGKLTDARAQFAACVNSCTADKQTAQKQKCSGWLAEVDRDIPTIVLSAKDGTGASLVDVTVMMDGSLLTKKMDGQPLPIDPGSHTFVFTAADGTKQEVTLLLATGQKNQVVAATLGQPPSAKPPESPAGGPPPSVLDTSTSSSSGWKTIGLAAGGLGIVGIAVGTIFGLNASSKKGACNGTVCPDQDTIDQAKSAATISTIGFVAGGVLLAGGASLVLFGPSGGSTQSGRIQAAPLVGTSGGGFVLKGTW